MSIVDVYPTVEDIVGPEDLTCQDCERSFANASALRLHRVKTHRILASIEDKRLFDKTTDDTKRTFIYHCPVTGCVRARIKFQGLRNLKQHYMRVHAEKTFICDCQAAFALQKDLLYHRKARCSLRTQDEIPPSSSSGQYTNQIKVNKNNTKKKPQQQQQQQQQQQLSTSSQVFIIVATNDIQSALNTVTSHLRPTCEVAVQAPVAEDRYQASTVNVGVGSDMHMDPTFNYNNNNNMDQHQQQQQMHNDGYFYSGANNNVRHMATGTEVMPDPSSIMNYNALCQTDFVYSYPQDVNNQQASFPTYSTSSTETKNFGTIMDDSLLQSSPSFRHAGTSMDESLDIFRDIQTQTYLPDTVSASDYTWDIPDE